MYDLIVIGGGAAGLMAAASAAAEGVGVLLLEKMSVCGRKIRITGKGRCNVTTNKSHEEIIAAIRTNPRFMYSSLNAFDNKAVKDFFESRGCALKLERGERFFPESDSAQEIVDVLVAEAVRQGVKIYTDREVESVSAHDDVGYDVLCKNGESYETKALLIATGGASYPGTGSNGDGYRWMKDLDVKIETPYPALVPLVSDEEWVKELQGLSLRNVRMTIEDVRGKVIYTEMGEMLFTHFGISGPIVLSASGHCASYWRKKSQPLTVHIDLKPALSEKQLDARLLREISENKNRQLNSMVKTLLPKKMIPTFFKLIGLSPSLPLNQVTVENRQRLIGGMKNFAFTISKTRAITEGIVTSGGVNVKEVNPATMAVKKRPGLFVCGELLDVDAYTGGFNLQIAFSTGYCAGKAAAQYIKEEKEHEDCN